MASAITQGKLRTSEDTSSAFHIGVEDVNRVVDLCRNLIKQKTQFAVLIPISVVGEIARQENVDGERVYDRKVVSSIEGLSRIVLAQDAEMLLISINGQRIDEFITLQKQVEANMQEMTEVQAAVIKARNSNVNIALRQEADQLHAESFHATSLNTEKSQAVLTNVLLPATRAMNKRAKSTEKRVSNSSADDSSIEGIPFGDRRPIITDSTLKWKRIPREPIPRISDFKLWVGKQLMHKNMPTKYQHMHPEGELIAMDSTYPEGLLDCLTLKDISE